MCISVISVFTWRLNSMSVWSAHHFWNMKFVFPFTVLPSALTTQQSSCPSREKPATVTGLLECRKRDETKLIKNLITGETDPCTHYSSSSTSFPSSHWSLEILEFSWESCLNQQDVNNQRQDKVVGIYLSVFLHSNYTVCLLFFSTFAILGWWDQTTDL